MKAYSLYDPEVGYCQGLSFIAGALLLNMPDEQAFECLVHLMHTVRRLGIYIQMVFFNLFRHQVSTQGFVYAENGTATTAPLSIRSFITRSFAAAA